MTPHRKRRRRSHTGFGSRIFREVDIKAGFAGQS